MLRFLRQEGRKADNVLSAFMTDHQREVEWAFRSLQEVNSLEMHDDLWPGFDDVQQMAILDRYVHPTYLKLVEAVLVVYLLPLAMRQRKGRAKSVADIPASQCVEECSRTALQPQLSCYDRVVRNSIAHGKVSYAKSDVTYQDKKQSRSMQPREMMRMFDDLLDLCNGIALSYHVFFLLHGTGKTGIRMPLSVMLQELRAQTEAPSWAIEGALEYELPNGVKQLNLSATTRFLEKRKLIYMALLTDTLAEELMPGFDYYSLSFRRGNEIAGWARLKGSELRALRQRGNASLAEIGPAITDAGLMVFPPKMKRWLAVPRVLGFVGSIVEAMRLSVREARRTRWTIGEHRILPRTGKIHRQALYAVIEARLVLVSPSLEDAIAFVRDNITTLAVIGSLHARKSAGLLAAGTKLPLGYGTFHVFLSDFRRRRLESYGLEDQHLCRIIIKRFGRIRIVPLATGISEKVLWARVDWNGRAVTREQLGLAASP